MCKVCGTLFSPDENRFSKALSLKCPYCSHALVRKKDRKHFIIHKCVNPKCPYYLHNLKKVDKADLDEDYGKNKYKLHYIYREFTIDFFKMDIHGISISHQMVANYCKTAAICIKPFVDTYPYEKGSAFVADETYIKVRSIKSYIWLIINVVTRAVIGYQVSDNRGVGPCSMAMRMAFQHLKELPGDFRFIADGYSAYPLAAQQFFHEFGEKFKFEITQVLGLTNDGAVPTEFWPFKQMIERLNRTYKASYRPTNSFDNYKGANYDLALWVAYYNFLRPHKLHKFQPPVRNDIIANGENMPGKWQLPSPRRAFSRLYLQIFKVR